MSMCEQIALQLAETSARGEIGGIIMTPIEMLRLLGEKEATQVMSKGDSGSSWLFMGAPCYRSREISGPCVVTRDVLAMLLKAGRYRNLGGAEGRMGQALAEQMPAQVGLDPLLF